MSKTSHARGVSGFGENSADTTKLDRESLRPKRNNTAKDNVAFIIIFDAFVQWYLLVILVYQTKTFSICIINRLYMFEQLKTTNKQTTNQKP